MPPSAVGKTDGSFFQGYEEDNCRDVEGFIIAAIRLKNDGRRKEEEEGRKEVSTRRGER